MSGSGLRSLHQRRPPRFAAGKKRGIGAQVQAEFSHHGARGIGVVRVSPRSAEHIIERRRKPGEVRLLRQIGEAGGRLLKVRSAVRGSLAGCDAKEGS